MYKNARGRATLTESTRPGTNVVNLEAGEIRFELVTKTGASARVSNVSWTVHGYRAGSQQGKEVALSQARRPALTLDAGWYEVRVRYDGDAQTPSSKTHVVEVEAGRRQTYSIVAE